MQDLLNETEFIQKPYNPWRVFYIFYTVAAAEVFLFQFLLLQFDLYILSLLLPVATSLTMFFWNRKNAALPFGSIAYALLLLKGVYFASVAFIKSIRLGSGVFTYKSVNELISIGSALFIYYIICIVIISIYLKLQKDIETVKSSEATDN